MNSPNDKTSIKRGEFSQHHTSSKRLTQRDMDSSCHRLSRVPQKFSGTKATQPDKSEPFAVSYFKNHPDVPQDTRSPEEKLRDIDEELATPGLEPNEKFDLLIQQKALRFINFGESSQEAMESLLAIGAFYNEQNRPESALRHLLRAKSLYGSLKKTADPQIGSHIAIEISTSHFSFRPTSQKHVHDAFDALKPYSDTEIENPFYNHKKHLNTARCFSFFEKYEEAEKAYEVAVNTFDAAYQIDKSTDEEVKTKKIMLAIVYTEAAENALGLDHKSAAKAYYQKEYDIYDSLGETDICAELQTKISSLGDDEDNENPNEADGSKNEGTV